MSDGQLEQAPKITQNGQFEEVVQFSPEPNPNKLAESPESVNFGRLFGRQPRLPEHRRAASRARYQGCTAIRCFKSNKPVPVYTPLDAPHGMGTRSVIEQPNAVVPFAVHLAALRVVNEVCQRLLVRLRVATFVEGHVVRANALVQRWEAFKLCPASGCLECGYHVYRSVGRIEQRIQAMEGGAAKEFERRLTLEDREASSPSAANGYRG